MRSTRPQPSWSTRRGKFRGTTLANGLVGSWGFGERSGALIRDTVAGRHAVMGAPASWVSNPFGGAGGAMKGVLSTTNSGARVPYHPDFNCLGGVTMSCLFRLGVTVNQFMSVVSKPFTTTITDPFQEYSIYVKDNAHLEFRVNSSNYETGSAYSAGQLMHAIFLCDGVNFKLWVNGTLEASVGDSRLPVNTNSQDLFFGQAASTENFDGTIKLVDLWNRGLTDEEARYLTQFPYGVPQASRPVYMRALAAGGGSTTGTFAANGSGGTVAMTATPVASGALAVTGNVGAVAMAGTTLVSGALAANGSGGTVAMTQGTVGVIAAGGSGGTVAMAATTNVVGAVAITGSGGAAAMAGGPIASGVLAAGGSGGTVAMSGTTNVPATIGMQGSGGTVAMAGTTTVAGAIAITGSGGSVSVLEDGAETGTTSDDMLLSD